MALFITRRRGESFSVRSQDGRDFVRVRVVKTGPEPLLAIDAASHLRIFRDDADPDPPGPRPIGAVIDEVLAKAGVSKTKAPPEAAPKTGLDLVRGAA